MVVVIIGILATALIYRLSPSQSTGVTVAADQLIADIQYVQVRAMGVGTQQGLTLSVGSSIYNVAGEERKLAGETIVSSTTLPGNPPTLTFNSLGEPMFFGNSDRAITLSGSKTLTIHAITGTVE